MDDVEILLNNITEPINRSVITSQCPKARLLQTMHRFGLCGDPSGCGIIIASGIVGSFYHFLNIYEPTILLIDDEPFTIIDKIDYYQLDIRFLGRDFHTVSLKPA